LIRKKIVINIKRKHHIAEIIHNHTRSVYGIKGVLLKYYKLV